ncbi:glycosyltransferase [Flavobacterium solisilvae]|uniref:Glycosyltransferase n=1 Tax=Flavobacterium solisilvae TaxID=1852019 RepID=A0ABX1QSS8_9FLAO|nr:glycosyltransferase [Flavobacterium solisilvae]NMH25324.1 glycosyltransferase [Flavobacterium solisilvae]
MKKLKILYTIPNFDTAGSGKVLYDLAANLDKKKFEVHIACSHSRGTFFQEVEKLGFPIHLIETTCKPKPYLTILKRIKPYRDFIKKYQFDVVHSWHWSSDWTEVLGAKLGGAKFVYTKKAMTWGNIHWKIRSYLSDFIITINEEMKNYFPNKKQQKLIPLGLDTEYYSPEHFSKKTNSEKLNIITVANLVPVKGVELLIDAVLKLNNSNINLTVLGDDRSDYATELKQKVKELNKENQIRFLGKHNDVRPFLAKSDLYVIPTLNEGRKEGMPMALVEAMSMGVPVLGSNITGINFVLKDFKELLFEAKNSSELAQKIDLFYKKTTDEKTEISQKLRSYVIENFSMGKFISEHEKLYLSLVKK